MKHIVRLLFLLLISSAAFGQNNSIGAPGSTVEAKGGFVIDSAFIIPWASSFKNKGTDTTGRIQKSKADSLPTYMKRGLTLKILTQWDSGAYYIPPSQKGATNGVANLDGTGKVPIGEIPSITASGQVFIDNSQAAMLGHAGATAGAFSVRTDSSNELFVLVTTPSSTRANWVATTYTNAVLAFNLRTGVVKPLSGDYGTDSVIEGVNNLYFTAARSQAQIYLDTPSILATQYYVNNLPSSSQISVVAASSALLSPAATYNNGTSGVGATLTGNTNAGLSLDGLSAFNNGDRVLIKNQAAPLQNGEYIVTSTGGSGSHYLLTRASNYNSASSINNAPPIGVKNGVKNASTIWVLTSNVATIGTDSLNYADGAPGTLASVLAQGFTANAAINLGTASSSFNQVQLGLNFSDSSGQVFVKGLGSGQGLGEIIKAGGYWTVQVSYGANFTVMKAQPGFGYLEVHDSDQEVIFEKFQHLRPDIRYQTSAGGLATLTLAWDVPDAGAQTLDTLPKKGGMILTALDIFPSVAAGSHNLLTTANISLDAALTGGPNSNQNINLGKKTSTNPYGSVLLGLNATDSSGRLVLLDSTHGAQLIRLATNGGDAVAVVSNSNGAISLDANSGEVIQDASTNTISLAPTIAKFINSSGKTYESISQAGMIGRVSLAIGKIASAHPFNSIVASLNATDSAGILTLSDSTLNTTATLATYSEVSQLSLSSSVGAATIATSTGVTTFHLVSNGVAPSIAAGAGAGTSPTVSIAGTDLAGYVNIGVGSSPPTSATVATITFARPYGSTPKCILITPANNFAAALTVSGKPFVNQANITNTGFQINIGTGALPAATALQFYYEVIQ